jgi:tetratricopeptide (TPR) repeat protein
MDSDPADLSTVTSGAGGSADPSMLTLGRSVVPADDQTRSSEDGTCAEQTAVSLRLHPRPSSVGPDGGADFVLGAEIGRGGMAAVHSAVQHSLGREVAIKRLHPGASPERTASFLAEAAILARLEHPGVVPVHSLGSDAGVPFLVMRRISGLPWTASIATRSRAENAEIILRLAETLAYAHAIGVIHRDLKPDNVMLGRFGEVLLIDWGVAAGIKPDAPCRRLTDAPPIAGTPRYMPPEQARGDRALIGVRSDVYGLGALLFQALVGVPPHPGRTRDETMEAARRNILVRHAAADEDPMLGLALAALSTDPGDRPATTLAFHAALRLALERDESRRLAADAREDLDLARVDVDYERYQRAMFRFDEALRRWPDNRAAAAGRRECRIAYAEAALQRGDLDLAAGLTTDRDDGLRELAARIDAALGERNSLARQAREQRERAEREAERLRAVNEFVTGLLQSASPEVRGHDTTIVEALQASKPAIGAAFAGRPDMRVPLHLVIGQTWLSLCRFDECTEQLALARTALAILEPDMHAPAWDEWWLLSIQQAISTNAVGGVASEADALVQRLASRLGSESQQTAHARSLLAEVLYYSGSRSAALDVARQACRDLTATAGPTHVLALRARIQLAGMLQALGQVDEAEREHEACLGLLDSHDPRFVLHRLYVLANLGCLFMDQGRWDEAEPVITELHQGRCAAYGAESARTLGSANLLAGVLLGCGRAGEADALATAALDARRRQRIDDPGRLGEPLLRCAAIALALGDRARAEGLLSEAETRLATLPADDGYAWLKPLAQAERARFHLVDGRPDRATAAAMASALGMEDACGHGDGRSRRLRVLATVCLRCWHARSASDAASWERGLDGRSRSALSRGNDESRLYPGLVTYLEP